MKLEEKLKKLSDPTPSNWREEAAKRISQSKSRRNSRIVALRVLRALKEQGISQTELANRLGVSRQQVSKIVKGQENFSFDTIEKLENALDIQLMTIHEPGEINMTIKTEWVVSGSFTTETSIVFSSDKSFDVNRFLQLQYCSNPIDDLFKRGYVPYSYYPFNSSICNTMNQIINKGVYQSFVGDTVTLRETQKIATDPGASRSFMNMKDIKYRQLEQC